MSQQPNPRFNQYTQIVKNDQVVGFKLDNNDFEFLFDKNGGWFDEQGKYYNADAIQCQPLEESSDEESQPEEKVQKQTKLSQDLLKLNVKDDNNRVQIIRELTEIVESYPQGKQIRIIISLQPPQQNEDQIIEQYLKNKFNQDLQVQQGLVNGILHQQLATSIIQLQGTKLQHLPNKPTVYVDVQLYASLQISFPMTRLQLESKFTELNYEKNVDYANVQEKVEDGKPRCYVQIRRDIEEELWEEELQFRIQDQ